MAESTVVHFATATWADLVPWLDGLAARVEERRWNYPEPFEPLLFIYGYDAILRENEPEDLGRLNRLLPGGPSSTLCYQLRRRHGDRSVEAAIDLTWRALRQFPGVADDTYA
jgi:hypothetical protein